jgi:hypothetical protein
MSQTKKDMRNLTDADLFAVLLAPIAAGCQPSPRCIRTLGAGGEEFEIRLGEKGLWDRIFVPNGARGTITLERRENGHGTVLVSAEIRPCDNQTG